MIGIYKISNNINGKVYIGKSKNIDKRFKQHIKDSRRVNDRRGKTSMYKDAREIGWDNFSLEVIENCIPESLDDREFYWIGVYLDKGNCYNVAQSQLKRLEDPIYYQQKKSELKKATDKMKKRVNQYDKEGNLVGTFDGVREASRITGISHHTIQKVAKGDKYRKTAGGFVWKYSEEKV